MKTSMVTALGLTALLGLGACSSDSKAFTAGRSTRSTTSAGASNDSSASGDASTGASSSGDSGDSSDSGDSGDVSLPDLSDITIPGGGSLPASFAACSQFLSAFGSAIGGDATGISNLSKLFDDLGDKVPADLQDSVVTLSKQFAALQKLYAKYDDDFSKIATDPDFTALVGNPDFAAASAKFNTWINAGCPQNG